ncbi:kinase-like domain-containing protein [Tribonema minus]|uniref:Kinase-like domain-containing protein n=1 Tax=Tribonema minus TaxID=303371 RepID=A0A835Z512_9STRA|nr:kinase-like domain-containing protein [Tribonema minus]
MAATVAMLQAPLVGWEPLPFSDPQVQPAVVEPADPPGVLDAQGTELLPHKEIVNTTTGTRWRLGRVLRNCQYGVVADAVKVFPVHTPGGHVIWEMDRQRRFAVKMLLWDQVPPTGLVNARPIFRQLVQGLSFLHRAEVQVTHRDVSMENMMLHSDDDASPLVIMDFGMALRYPAGPPGTLLRHHPGGKYIYMSPESMLSQPFHPQAVDVWAAGVTLFILLTGQPPFKYAALIDKRFRKIALSRQLQEQLEEQGYWDVSAQATDLIQGCLLRDPSQRFTTQQLCDHPWFHMS